MFIINQVPIRSCIQAISVQRNYNLFLILSFQGTWVIAHQICWLVILDFYIYII